MYCHSGFSANYVEVQHESIYLANDLLSLFSTNIVSLRHSPAGLAWQVHLQSLKPILPGGYTTAPRGRSWALESPDSRSSKVCSMVLISGGNSDHVADA